MQMIDGNELLGMLSNQQRSPAGRRILLAGFITLVCVATAFPAHASTYFPETRRCAVGGEKFEYLTLGSISTFGEFPDGMPIGSGTFPIALPQCPKNGLVMYREFTRKEVKALTELITSSEYQKLRMATETPYYLAYRTARHLGDTNAVWLLLNATWEAKNLALDSEQARRYNTEFTAAANAIPRDGSVFESIALHARRANALRELGRFGEADALRSAIAIAPDAGGSDEQASENRKAWQRYMERLARPIARHDQSRMPIDMLGEDEAAMRCVGKETAAKYDMTAPEPLTAFEESYCASPEIAEHIAERRKSMLE